MKPNHLYYHRLQGRWSGPFRLRVTRPLGLLRSDIGWLNKIQVVAFALGRLLFGAPRLHTAVEIESEELVHHFSRIERFGFCLYSAEEDFALCPDGRALAISGTEKSLFFHRLLHPGRGWVDDDALRAVYQWRWFDQDWTMENESDGQGLRVKIQCPWAQARVYLKRRASETVP
jgi:hypothetical protein